ncbi:asparaginase [Paenibacillus sp. N3.4]|uniref:asparaginase n=1 Tax=Paenibacillus sp. N3.4 TaxID=2603222 RepID=UPI0011C79C2A|nr:asparaginase [Paenibacillus sp. N3.4]TXK84178.1 asparaginase [Paenibacillus sp. N3.4]
MSLAFMSIKQSHHMYALLAMPSAIDGHSMKMAVRRIAGSMMEQTEMVGGIDVLCTDLMRALPNKVVAKGGAEGVYCIGLVESGIGMAIKIDDGNYRAAYPAAIETLVQLGMIDQQEQQELVSYRYPLIRNCIQAEVGRIEPVFRLPNCKETAG